MRATGAGSQDPTARFAAEAGKRWVVSRNGVQLHAVAAVLDPPDGTEAAVLTTCRRRVVAWLPGEVHQHWWRCRTCCARTGTQRGRGSPLSEGKA